MTRLKRVLEHSTGYTRPHRRTVSAPVRELYALAPAAVIVWNGVWAVQVPLSMTLKSLAERNLRSVSSYTHERVHTIRDAMLAAEIKHAVSDSIAVGQAIEAVIAFWQQAGPR